MASLNPSGKRSSHSTEGGRRSPYAQNKEDVSSKYGHFFQESTVLSEYCQLLQNSIPGVYVLSSSISPLMWYGLMFISNGLYEGAVFKFTLSIPTNYPDGGSPRFDFQSGVYHPQVNFHTGELETKRHFQRWRRDINYLRDLLVYAKNIFYTIECECPLNVEASELYTKNLEDFKENVRESMKECKQATIDDSDKSDPHSILIETWSHEVMKSAREHIFEPQYKTEDNESESGLPNGLSWVKQNKPFSIT